MKKYSIKLILYTHQSNAQGLFAIYIRTTINRKTSYKATGHFTTKNLWDEKNQQLRSVHPNSKLINARLSMLKSEWEKKLITTQLRGADFTALQLKESFKADYHNIFDYVEGLIKKLKGKKSDTTLENYRKHLLKLEAFNKGRVLSFESIDVDFLRRYEAWLRDNINFRKTEMQKNYIHAIWKTLKTFFNAAKREGMITRYPFDVYENPVYVAPDKDYLSLEELSHFETFADECTNPVLKESAIYFLFGCYSGLRISDWYQFKFDKHIKGDKIRLRPA